MGAEDREPKSFCSIKMGNLGLVSVDLLWRRGSQMLSGFINISEALKCGDNDLGKREHGMRVGGEKKHSSHTGLIASLVFLSAVMADKANEVIRFHCLLLNTSTYI